MTKRTLKIFAMLNLLLVMTAISVVAQSSRSTTNIPFSFTIGDKTLPAGSYSIEPYRRNSDNVWLVQSRDGGTSVLFNTNASRSQTEKKNVLVFRNRGGQYFLSQIWTGDGNSGRELTLPRTKDELAKNNSASETVIVAIGQE